MPQFHKIKITLVKEIWVGHEAFAIALHEDEWRSVEWSGQLFFSSLKPLNVVSRCK